MKNFVVITYSTLNDPDRKICAIFNKSFIKLVSKAGENFFITFTDKDQYFNLISVNFKDPKSLMNTLDILNL